MKVKKKKKKLKPMTTSKLHLKGKNFSTCNVSFYAKILLKKKVTAQERCSGSHCRDEAV